MTAGILIWCLVLAFFGLNMSLVAWVILRFTAGPFWALVAFNAVLVGTCYGILQLVA